MASKNNQSFSRLVEEMRARVIAINTDNPGDIEPTIKDCGSYIRKMNAALGTARDVGKKQHITSCIALMQGFRSMLKSLRGAVGGGYQPTHPHRHSYASLRVKWVELESAFANRIRTGAVINLQHKDPREFLEDAQGLFNKRIKNDLKKNTAVKVNAAFCGEFVVVKGDEEKYEFKYIKTKNSPIYRDTDITAWFRDNVHSPILAQLEEFQVCNLIKNLNN